MCRAVLLFAAIFSFLANAHAGTVTVPAVNAGFVTEMGGSSKGDGTVAPPATYNYSVGREVHYSDGALFSPLVSMDRKNFFVFDLGAVPGPITSATLFVYAGPDTAPPFPGGAHGYESLDASETFVVGETTDPGGAMAHIGAISSSVDPADFDDASDPFVMGAKDLYMKLADGPLVLSSATLSPADDGTTIAMPITPGGLGYLNLFVGGPLVLGGKLTTAPPPDTPQSVFGYTGPAIPMGDPLTPMLMITYVPEPGTCTLALLAGVFVWCARRRRSA
jgi:hypothetical protein